MNTWLGDKLCIPFPVTGIEASQLCLTGFPFLTDAPSLAVRGLLALLFSESHHVVVTRFLQSAPQGGGRRAPFLSALCCLRHPQPACPGPAVSCVPPCKKGRGCAGHSLQAAGRSGGRNWGFCGETSLVLNIAEILQKRLASQTEMRVARS